MNKLNNIRLIFLLAISLLTVTGCKTNKEQQDSHKYSTYLKGTVTRMELDGCNWMIKLEDGKHLEPINLTDEYKIEGLKIWLQYKHHDGFSICMAGEMANITSIEKRK